MHARHAWMMGSGGSAVTCGALAPGTPYRRTGHARRDRRVGARRGHPEGDARERCWRNMWYARDTADRATYLVGLDGRRDLGGMERADGWPRAYWLAHRAGWHRPRHPCGAGPDAGPRAGLPRD